ncbi:MAG: RNA 2',3'-cyclic phosphodiesterase [Candidatus Omnitrophica bacterium]|nr:RNA 2',3'-cyclic phosphodiesterase [Candidatus Omnitrophota bacterium]
MRAFIAIELPSGIKNAISKIQYKLKTTLPKISWVKPTNLHLTLKFLGEITSKKLSDINQIITETTQVNTSFKIKLETVGIFPNITKAHIIWIGTEDAPETLKQIIGQLETKLGQYGIAKEKRPFRTHITIGRLKSRIVPSKLEKSLGNIKTDMVHENLEFVARGITLFQSTLSPSGPIYTALKKASLKIT